MQRSSFETSTTLGRHRTPGAVALLSAALLFCPSARGQTVKVLSKHSIAFRAESPTFTLDLQQVPLDRGALLYLGRGIREEQDTAHLLRLADGKVIKLRVPVATNLPARWRTHQVRRILSYDTTNGEAGVELTERGKGPHRRHYWLVWDLKKNAVTRAVPVGASDERQWTTFRPVGYVPARQTAYYLRVTRATSGSTGSRAPRHDGPSKAVLLAIRGTAAREVAAFEIEGPVYSRTYLDAAHDRVLVAQYAEEAHGKLPVGVLVHLETGKLTRLTLPYCTYGAAFAEDGRELLAYSGQTGELWAIDLGTGKVRRRVNVGDRGHALGLVRPGQLLLLRNRGLQPIRLRGLRKGRLIPSTKIYPGVSHVEGSSVLGGGQVVLKNRRTDLYLLSVTP